MTLNGLLQGIGTITAFIAFIGICLWAYSGKRKSGFDEAALLPFHDDADLCMTPRQDSDAIDTIQDIDTHGRRGQ
jgi:cytochrome c oxidase cbb3-type subunit 4